MHSNEALAQLDHHQRLIGQQIARARQLVRQPASIARVDLAHARWRMVRLLRSYQLFKHTEIFDPLIASTNPSRVLAARRLKAACLDTGERYRVYTLRWSSDDVEGRWPAFVAAFEEMVSAIERHLVAERRGVHDLLSGTIRTRYN